MKRATELDVPMAHWGAGVKLFALSDPYDDSEHIAIAVGPTGTSVFIADSEGATVADPNGFGLISHRTEYPPISHDEMVAALGYEVTDGAT